MLIRSQDRKSLNPIGRIDIEKGNGFFMLHNLPFAGAGTELGRYASESRCLEILNEIQAEFQYVRNVTDTQGAVHFVYEPPKVYQMPEL